MSSQDKPSRPAATIPPGTPVRILEIDPSTPVAATVCKVGDIVQSRWESTLLSHGYHQIAIGYSPPCVIWAKVEVVS